MKVAKLQLIHHNKIDLKLINEYPLETTEHMYLCLGLKSDPKFKYKYLHTAFVLNKLTEKLENHSNVLKEISIECPNVFFDPFLPVKDSVFHIPRINFTTALSKFIYQIGQIKPGITLNCDFYLQSYIDKLEIGNISKIYFVDNVDIKPNNFKSLRHMFNIQTSLLIDVGVKCPNNKIYRPKKYIDGLKQNKKMFDDYYDIIKVVNILRRRKKGSNFWTIINKDALSIILSKLSPADWRQPVRRCIVESKRKKQKIKK